MGLRDDRQEYPDEGARCVEIGVGLGVLFLGHETTIISPRSPAVFNVPTVSAISTARA
jgi:hypothetical protein